MRASSCHRGASVLTATAAVGVLAWLLVVAGAGGAASGRGTPLVQAVVTLDSPPAAFAADRRVAAVAIEREQRRFVTVLRRVAPGAEVRWRYRLVANGVAVLVRRSEVPLLRRLPGVRSVDMPVRYELAEAQGPREIGAPALWGALLDNQGQGMKIAVIDDGIDQTHPFFDPRGYTMPPGFPRGQASYTTAKVIVARAFPPPGADSRYAGRPFDPDHSDHATHVAGIAAGNANTRASGGELLSGVAPRAQIGNYKALTVPTDAGVGLDGNAPEIVAAIEAAVSDGMDVINLSIGEPEAEPTRDIVALALDAAAAAGVVPVVAAGNDYATFGGGSVTSPGNSEAAITVAATSNEASAATPEVAGFSSAGPTALSLRLKPDVSAPGASILSSAPGSQWRTLSGTSMAAPHVAGAAALLRQRHPEWTVAQIKAALVGTARVTRMPGGGEAPPTRAGSGAVDVAAAADPLLFAAPTGVSFGLSRPGIVESVSVALSDAGGGDGVWDVVVETVPTAGGANVTAPAQVTVPGTLKLLLSTVGATAGELSGIVRVQRGGVVRRIPFWTRIVEPALARATPRRLLRPGVYEGDTRGGPTAVDLYLYPDLPGRDGRSIRMRGPEQVFRVILGRPAVNLGVAVVSRARGTTVEPRIVSAGNESRLMGYAALPININPYLAQFEAETPVSGVLSPLAGAYDVVFDSRTRAGAGAFTFRFWVNDVTPPTLRPVTRTVRKDVPLDLRVADAGSGVDPTSIVVSIDGTPRAHRLGGGVLRVQTLGLAPGPHRLRVQVSDYQETRNNENVRTILPNTRVLATTFRVT